MDPGSAAHRFTLRRVRERRVKHGKMAITISASEVPGAPAAPRLSTPQVWGIVLIAPYLLVFLAFVVYPVA